MFQEHPYVNLRVGVGKFYYGEGCIEKLAEEITRLGGKPLFIGGEKSMAVVKQFAPEAFQGAVVRIHEGACSRNAARTYMQTAQENGCTVLVGVGGGKCLDLAKCTATFAQMDLICVPTSVATCVASSTVCIMYHDDGTPDGSVAMNKEVDVVLADVKLIATAPKRTLAAGIFDSIAKLPEVVHNQEIATYQDCILEKYICTVNSQAIYAFLMGEGAGVYDQGGASGRFTDVVLTNLLHTSIVSGFSYGVDQLALAHGLYDFVRRAFTAEAKDMLHGEIVAVGVLMQLHFNGTPQEEIDRVRGLMLHMQMPTTLPEIGFEPTGPNLQQLEAYLIPSTAVAEADLPKLREAIATICK